MHQQGHFVSSSAVYLAVCSNGGLIVVRQYFDFSGITINSMDNPLPPTNGFQVYKLDLMTSSWVEVYNIGDDILFFRFQFIVDNAIP